MPSRIIAPYKTRVVLPALDVMNTTSSAVLLVPKPAIEVFRYLLRYARREVNWSVNTLPNGYYTTPSVSQWDDILAMVDETENALMSYLNGEEIQAAIESIDAQLDAITSALDALSCICPSILAGGQIVQAASGNAPDIATEIEIASTNIPTVNSELCDLANTVWGVTYELLSETVLPLMVATADALAAAIAATTTFAVLTGGLGLTLAIAQGLFAALILILAQGLSDNLLNWMIGNAQEAICVMYVGLKGGGFMQAASDMADFITDADGISGGDKSVLKTLLTSVWMYKAIQYSIDNENINPESYVNYSCADCELPDGCYNFCDESWYDVVPEVGEDCSIEFNGPSYAVQARRSVSAGVYNVRLVGRYTVSATPQYVVTVSLAGEDATFTASESGSHELDWQALASIEVFSTSILSISSWNGAVCELDYVCLESVE